MTTNRSDHMRLFGVVAVALLAIAIVACGKIPPVHQPGDAPPAETTPQDLVGDAAVADIEKDVGDLETIDRDLDMGDLQTLDQDLGQI
jgi:hypothetical protein